MEYEYERKFVFYIIYLVNGDDVIGSNSQQTHIRRPERKDKTNLSVMWQAKLNK